MIEPWQTVLDTIGTGNFDALIGVVEDQHFEAKGARPYELKTKAGRHKLAKDVSAFANASGGLLLIGAKVSRDKDTTIDRIRGLELFTSSDFEPIDYEKASNFVFIQFQTQ